MGCDYTISLKQLKSAIFCLVQKQQELTERLDALEIAATESNEITDPDVSTYDDSRGIVGDWSYNESTETYFFKVSSSPHTWISHSVASSAS